jgi:hypothetical protein
MRRFASAMMRLTASVAVAAALCWTAPDLPALRDGVADPEGWLRREDADGLVAQVAGATGWLVLAWLTIGSLVTAASTVPGAVGRLASAVAARTVPLAVRRVAAVALGLSLAGHPGRALAMPAPPEAGPHGIPVSSWSGDVDWPLPELPAPVVDWPLPESNAPAGSRPAAPAPERVVVRRGDTLWSIAAAHLEPRARNAEIAAEWPRWYAANQRLIGPDPARLDVGLRLRPPRSG